MRHENARVENVNDNVLELRKCARVEKVWRKCATVEKVWRKCARVKKVY